MATYCNTEAACPEAIRAELTRIEEAAGDYAVSHKNPCGLAAYYDEGNPLPWRIAEDGASDQFATADEAADAAESWRDE